MSDEAIVELEHEIMQLRAENEQLHLTVRGHVEEINAWKARFDKLLQLAVRL